MKLMSFILTIFLFLGCTNNQTNENNDFTSVSKSGETTVDNTNLVDTLEDYPISNLSAQ